MLALQYFQFFALYNLAARQLNLSDAKLSGADFSGTKLNSADLSSANLIEAKNLTPEQIKQAKNWEKAIYTPEFYKQLY